MASKNGRRQRDTTDTTNDLSLDDSLLSPLSPLLDTPVSPLTEVLDRRQWHPDASSEPFKTRSGGYTVTRLVDKRPSPKQLYRGFRPHSQTKAILAFADPQNTVVCIRRRARREVLFAKRRTRGAGARRRHWHSNVKC